MCFLDIMMLPYLLITEHARATETNLNIKLTFWGFSYFVILRNLNQGKVNEKAKFVCLFPNLHFVVLGILLGEFLVTIVPKLFGDSSTNSQD